MSPVEERRIVDALELVAAMLHEIADWAGTLPDDIMVPSPLYRCIDTVAEALREIAEGGA